MQDLQQTGTFELATSTWSRKKSFLHIFAVNIFFGLNMGRYIFYKDNLYEIAVQGNIILYLHKIKIIYQNLPILRRWLNISPPEINSRIM